MTFHSEEGMDLETFEEVFKTYYAAIRNYLYYKTSNVDMAEDLAQDVFFKLWETRDRVRMNSVKAYLYTMANNMAINQLKREQLRFKFWKESPAPTRDDQNPEFLAQENEFKEKLEQILGKMPEKSRIVFLMNRIEDLTYAEIAARLEISVKAVEKRMSKALAYVRENVGHKV